jgi:hypothetical protein
MKKMTMKNSFHDTEVTILVPNGIDHADAYSWLERRADRWDEAAARTLRRVRRTLCGITGCSCGTVRD